jgi:uncharacterized membrane protein YdbT with pleckstrin-like domain
METTFITSRLSEGNKVFPTKIIIDNQGVTVEVPGVFSKKEETIPFTKISSVKADCPFIGFSTLIIETTGNGRVSTCGFTKDEVKRMKELILKNI